MKHILTRIWKHVHTRELHTPKGGLSMYWSVMIGVILISGYLVGGLIPSRHSPTGTGQKLSYLPPAYQEGLPVLQLGSMLVGGCQGKPAILFLIDSSESMRRVSAGTNTRKIDLVKNALVQFSAKVTDSALLGIVAYSDESSIRYNFREIGPNRASFQTAVGSLGVSGLSYFRNGMETAESMLTTAKKTYPDYQFNLIIISDGIPETAECVVDRNQATCNCRESLCYAMAQDPTTDPNVAKRIRDLGVNIYTIGIQGDIPAENAFAAEYQKMLSSIASEPLTRHFIITPSASSLRDILSRAGTSLCLETANASPLATPTPTPSPTPTPTPSPSPTKTPTPTPTPTRPPFKPGADIMLVIDNSNSMSGRIANARNAAANFINEIAKNPINTVGVGTFDENPGTIRQGLTKTYSAATGALWSFGVQGNNGTCLQCVLDHNKNNNDVLYQFQSIAKNPRKIIIILTDGQINRWQKPDGTVTGGNNPNNAAGKAEARTRALNALNRIPATDVWVIDYSGSGTLAGFARGSGSYVNAANQDLIPIYKNLATTIL